MMGRMGQVRGARRALALASVAFLATACLYSVCLALFAQPAFGDASGAGSVEESSSAQQLSSSGIGAQALDAQEEGDQDATGDNPSSDAVQEESSESSGASGSSAESSSTPSAGSSSSAASSSSSASAALDASDLKDGTYTVAVTLMQADNVTKASMAGPALNGTHNLTVEDGQYQLAVALGTISLGSITGYVKQIDYFPSYSISGNRLTTSGNAVKRFTASKKGDVGPATIPVLDNAKTQGFVAVQLYSDEMPVSPQKAALKIDWSTLKVGQIAQEPETGDSGADKSKLKSSITSAAAALNKGGKAASATQALEDALAAAKKVNSNADATQDEVDAAKDALDKALATYNASKDETVKSSSTQSTSASSTSSSKKSKKTSKKGFQAGHVYAVPMSFTKAGSSDSSMANQYFGSTAYVRPLKNGKFDVRFSTNRSDYVTSISHNGSKLSTTSANGNNAEYKMVVNSTKSNATYRMSLDIKPMRELGGGPVEADLHLSYSQATDKGSDTGQVSSSANNGSSSSSASTSANRAVGAQATGDGQSFEVGQTYTVPAEFTKAGTSEKSMADQYFEDTAEVKPVEGGKYEVTITTNRSDYVTSIKYDGTELKVGAENDKVRSYTMTVPSSKSDATYTLSMTIKPMQELGSDAVDADLHLRYSQAVNKATGRPVSGSAAPQTGDASRLVIVALASLALASALVLLAGRKQLAA